jgi:hypothetical protein
MEDSNVGFAFPVDKRFMITYPVQRLRHRGGWFQPMGLGIEQGQDAKENLKWTMFG